MSFSTLGLVGASCGSYGSIATQLLSCWFFQCHDEISIWTRKMFSRRLRFLLLIKTAVAYFISQLSTREEAAGGELWFLDFVTNIMSGWNFNLNQEMLIAAIFGCQENVRSPMMFPPPNFSVSSSSCVVQTADIREDEVHDVYYYMLWQCKCKCNWKWKRKCKSKSKSVKCKVCYL